MLAGQVLEIWLMRVLTLEVTRSPVTACCGSDRTLRRHADWGCFEMAAIGGSLKWSNPSEPVLGSDGPDRQDGPIVACEGTRPPPCEFAVAVRQHSLCQPAAHRHWHRHQPSHQILAVWKSTWACRSPVSIAISPWPAPSIGGPDGDSVWRRRWSQLSRSDLGRPATVLVANWPGRAVAAVGACWSCVPAGGRPALGFSPCRGAPRKWPGGKVRLNWGWNYWRAALCGGLGGRPGVDPAAVQPPIKEVRLKTPEVDVD